MTARTRKVVALPASVTAGASALSARESFKRAIASAAEAADDMFERFENEPLMYGQSRQVADQRRTNGSGLAVDPSATMAHG